MESAQEKKKKKCRALYELLFAEARIPTCRISGRLGWNRSAFTILREARELQYVIGPEIRKGAFRDTLEYVYFFNAEDPDEAYLTYREDPQVVYSAQLLGFCNALVMSKERLDLAGDIVLEGPRSDYCTPYTPDQSWHQALQNMRVKVEEFNPDAYARQGFIGNHWDEMAKWDRTDELLYTYFKYDVRKKATPLMREQHLSKNVIYYWLETLDKRCTIHTGFYPETLSVYDTYVYTFETEYEDFIVDLFSELPTTTSFFKVRDNLIVFSYIPMGFVRNIDPQTADKSYIPLIERDLLQKGIVKKKKRAIIEYSCKKNL